MRIAAVPLLALVGLLASSCVSDTHAAPLPGRDVRVLLGERGFATAHWPASWSRGARFLVENRTGAPLETILLDLGGEGAPRELVEVEIEEPAGAPSVVLPSPVGSWPLRARLGNPGTVLLEPGAVLSLRLRVDGAAGKTTVRFDVPR